MKTPEGSIIEQRRSSGMDEDASNLLAEYEATNGLSGGPTTVEDLIQREKVKGREADLTALRAKIVEFQAKAAGNTGVQATRAVREIPPEPCVKLAEAARDLGKLFELEPVILSNLFVHRSFEIPGTMVEAGVLSNVDQYEELLRNAVVNGNDLQAIEAALQSSANPQSMLLIPPLTEKFKLEDLLRAIFDKLPLWQGTVALAELNAGKWKRTNPYDIPKLLDLCGNTNEERTSVSKHWAQQYKRSKSVRCETSQLIVTPDNLEVPADRRGKSALQDMQDTLGVCKQFCVNGLDIGLGLLVKV